MNLITKYSLVFALLPAIFPVAAQAQTQFPNDIISQSAPEGQVNYDRMIWKDSNDYAKAAEQSYYRGEYKEAERLCQKATDKAPLTPDGKSHQGNSRVVQVLSMVYIREQKYADAIKLYDDLYAANPDTYFGGEINPLNLAISYFRLGKYDQASQYYKRYEKMTYRDPGPTDPPVADYPGTDTPTKLESSILMHRGAYMAVYGSKSEGLIDLRRAHELMPDNPIVAHYLVLNLSLDKDGVEKLALYKIIEKNAHGKSMVDEAKNDRIYLEYVIAHPGQ